MVQAQQPRSVLDALIAYQEAVVMGSDSPAKANATMAQLRTALLRYTLPAWGFPLPQGQRLKEEEIEAGLNRLGQIELKELPAAPALQEEQFERLQVPGNSRRNYRMALNKMMEWCQQQRWYPSSEEVLTRADVRKKQRRGSVQDVRLTKRKKLEEYALGAVKGDVIPAPLQQEIDAFYKFLITPDQHPDLTSAISEATANQHKHHLLLVLGWLHRVWKVPLTELHLTTVVEFVPVKSVQKKEDKAEAIAAADRSLTLVKDYLEWLQAEQPQKTEQNKLDGRGSQSPHTVTKVLIALIAVAKYLYRQETEYPRFRNYEDIPVIESFRAEQRRVRQSLTHTRVSDASKTEITKSEFLDLVEVLRAECAPEWRAQKLQSRRHREDKDAIRSPEQIAQSYQRFLLAALMAYLPPLRQRVYRQLQFFQDPDALKQALESKKGAYLYQEGDKWWIQVFPDLHKSDNGTTQFWREEVPDRMYDDERHFYQYWEEWLVCYTASSGDIKEHLPGLRSVLNPTHSFVFTTQGGKPYTHAALFAALLRSTAYRLTGKALSLDSVRLMLLEQAR